MPDDFTRQLGNPLAAKGLNCCVVKTLVDPHTLHLVTRMAVTLNGLPCISPFDCIGKPATLAQRWEK